MPAWRPPCTPNPFLKHFNELFWIQDLCRMMKVANDDFALIGNHSFKRLHRQFCKNILYYFSTHPPAAKVDFIRISTQNIHVHPKLLSIKLVRMFCNKKLSNLGCTSDPSKKTHMAASPLKLIRIKKKLQLKII